jgi:hypothetical protein
MRHSGESRNPVFLKMFWTPAFAGVTIQETFCETTKFGLTGVYRMGISMTSRPH